MRPRSTRVILVGLLLAGSTAAGAAAQCPPTLSAAECRETEGWFAFDPRDDLGPSVIDASEWLDAPAGRHGVLRMDGDRFVFEDGTPVKFWGVNIGSSKVYPQREEAERWARYLAKYGVNAVRMHKFTGPGLEGEPTSTRLKPELLDRMDHFSSVLRRRGIYYGWSHIYGHRPRPGDRDRLLAYDEIAGIQVPWSHLNGSTSGLVNFAPDLQDLHIELTIELLNHRNPYTGLRYADDPALAFVELQNEDNLFWSAIEKALEQTPTYRALLNRQFSTWLRGRYGSHAALVSAWGSDALAPGEHLDRNNVYPRPNHGWFQAEFQRAEQEGRPVARHYLDRARFLYETQLAFYQRFVDAVRATGYRGPIVASGWQAGVGITHFYNLHTDRRAGFIDRHDYFGGGAGHRLVPGPVRNEPMVSRPGSGLLSTGLQQVSDRPFVLSEWMSLLPNEWTAEAAPIVAVYGMGLQGWDASYSFATNSAGLSDRVESDSHGVYNADSPLHMTLYPTLSRMVYRGDVREAPVVSARNVHLPGVAERRLGLDELVEQDRAADGIGETVPQEALAAGRVVVSFVEDPHPTAEPELDRYRDGGVLRSVTGQLAWRGGERGHFTIDTPGTQGVVGFASGRTHALGEVAIEVRTPFAVVLVTSLDRGRPVAEADRLLVTTVARARNTGMRYDADRAKLLEVGVAPVLMEPVRATLTLRRGGDATVHVLDHVGRRTGQTLPLRAGVVELDGAREQTVYYEIEYSAR